MKAARTAQRSPRKARGSIEQAEAGHGAEELVPAVADDEVVGPQPCRQGVVSDTEFAIPAAEVLMPMLTRRVTVPLTSSRGAPTEARKRSARATAFERGFEAVGQQGVRVLEEVAVAGEGEADIRRTAAPSAAVHGRRHTRGPRRLR